MVHFLSYQIIQENIILITHFGEELLRFEQRILCYNRIVAN